jgi:dolichyl-phosphate beta-glucosyltransferase
VQPFEMTMTAGPMRSASSSEPRAEWACPDPGTAATAKLTQAGGDPTPVATAGVCAGGTPAPSVSIVIPAFNESRRIADSLGKLREFLGTTSLSFEILVVDDGSTDGTGTIVSRFEGEGVRLISHHQRRGKGHSVRTGMLKATGTYVLFTDADLSTPIDELLKLYDTAERDAADIVIGSRALDRRYIERHQSRFRETGGILFNRLVRIGLGLKLHDTQCGFKLFHRERTRSLFEKQTIDGFGFDPEILFLAARRRLRVREMSVRWSHADDTKVRVIRDGLRMVADLVRIRLNDFAGKYGPPR